MSNENNKLVSFIRIAMGAYTLGAIILTYCCIIMGMQPALFWHDFFTDNFTSVALITYTNKFTFLFTLITLILPAVIVVVIAALFEKKS